MSDFESYGAWQRARALIRAVYAATETFPAAERYGLSAQLRRASNSIGANLAEGSGRESRADLRRFVTIALGSTSEVEHHIIISHDLGFLRPEEFRRLRSETIELRRMLTAARRRLSDT